MSTISNPRGNLSSICKILKQFARYGDVAGIRSYVRGCSFLAAFNRLDPERRHSAMLAYFEAYALCEVNAKLPLAAPIALNARTSAKLANWRDPAMRTKLAHAYARAKDHEGAARILGVTVGAARLAKRRYLDRVATDNNAKARNGPTGRRRSQQRHCQAVLGILRAC
jgi:hypothetical protein